MAACHMTTIQNNRHLIAFLYICSTGHDLYLTACLIDLYLTDHKLICIRMLLDLIDLSNDDLVQILI